MIEIIIGVLVFIVVIFVILIKLKNSGQEENVFRRFRNACKKIITDC